MPRPIDAAASLLQSQNVLELAQTAQRMAQIAQIHQQALTERAKEQEESSITRDEEAAGKTIRDDDPRSGRRRRRRPGGEHGCGEQNAPPHVDIVV